MHFLKANRDFSLHQSLIIIIIIMTIFSLESRIYKIFNPNPIPIPFPWPQVLESNKKNKRLENGRNFSSSGRTLEDRRLVSHLKILINCFFINL
jgi:hypothetical protein